MSLNDELIKTLNSYLEYKSVKDRITYSRNGSQHNIRSQNKNLEFKVEFNLDRQPFCDYSDKNGSRSMHKFKIDLNVDDANQVLRLLRYNPINTNQYATLSSMHNWKDILSDCYSIVYLHCGSKKVMYLYKNETVDDVAIPLNVTAMNEFTEIHCNYLKINSKNIPTDLRHLNIELGVDELHYFCGCIDSCGCDNLNLPIMNMKKFYNNGIPIDIPSIEFWKQYKQIKPCYTFQNKYVIVNNNKGSNCQISITLDYNQYINDNFNKTSTPTGYFYRLDETKLIVLPYENQNWPLTDESATELMKLIKKVVFIPNNIESIKRDLEEIKKLLPYTEIEVTFTY